MKLVYPNQMIPLFNDYLIRQKSKRQNYRKINKYSASKYYVCLEFCPPVYPFYSAKNHFLDLSEETLGQTSVGLNPWMN